MNKPKTFVLKQSGTQQQFKRDADLNVLMGPYTRPKSQPPPAQWGDFTNSPKSLQDALNLVLDARTRFDSLPSAIRARFRNDPIGLVRFVQDDKNRDEAVSLGLIPKPAPSSQPAPQPA